MGFVKVIGFAKQVQLSQIFFFPSLFDINFKLARREFFIFPLLENYSPYEILSRYSIYILYGIGTFYSHLPTLIRIERIGTLRLAAETFLTGRDFCQKPFCCCEDSCSMKRFGNTSPSKACNFHVENKFIKRSIYFDQLMLNFCI